MFLNFPFSSLQDPQRESILAVRPFTKTHFKALGFLRWGMLCLFIWCITFSTRIASSAVRATNTGWEIKSCWTKLNKYKASTVLVCPMEKLHISRNEQDDYCTCIKLYIQFINTHIILQTMGKCPFCCLQYSKILCLALENQEKVFVIGQNVAKILGRI